jgi:ABC-type multidrug transport system fused ATPase/permease subunit
LSAGEKQLLNLARALLSPKGIVLMDEAAANIDTATDEILLHTMKSSFENRTVLTVAHRITTVLDCGKILVMDAGKVAEFDSPKNLLKMSQYWRNDNGPLGRVLKCTQL